MFRSSAKIHSAFISEGELEKKDSVGSFSHTTSKMKKRIPREYPSDFDPLLPEKYKNFWYFKRVKDTTIAEREVVAQEFFRLLIPSHPKTRLVIDAEGGVWVASKQIEGQQSLPPDVNWGHEEKHAWNEAIRNGTYTGLGEVTTIALLMNEVDLKTGNLRLDYQRRLVKFDGDWCFARLEDKKRWRNTDITSYEITMLPFPGGYQAWNWMGIIYESVRLPKTFLDIGLCFHPRVRAEVNHALLKAFLLPNDLIKNFIAFYVSGPVEIQAIYEEFINRREQMKIAAFQNEDFVAYLRSEQAEKHLNDYINYLTTFKTVGKNFICQTLKNPEQLFSSQWDQLRKKALPRINLPEEKIFTPEIKDSKLEHALASSQMTAKYSNQPSLNNVPIEQSEPGGFKKLMKNLCVAMVSCCGRLGKQDVNHSAQQPLLDAEVEQLMRNLDEETITIQMMSPEGLSDYTSINIANKSDIKQKPQEEKKHVPSKRW